MSNLRFTDVPAKHWASIYVNFLADVGIVKGVGNNIFNPSGTVTIGELCTMAVNAAGLVPYYGSSWVSNSGDHWARKYVDYVRNIRKISLFAEDKLTIAKISDVNIDMPIQRQFTFNIAWHIVAFARSSNKSYSDILYNSSSFPFSDRSDVLPYNREGVYKLVTNNIVSGRPGGILAPKDNLTRAEASTVISKCIASPDEISVLMMSDNYEVTGGPLNVRVSPSTASNTLGKLAVNQNIKIVLPRVTDYDGSRPWIKIHYGSNEGWVAEEYIRSVPIVNDNYIVTVASLDVKESPSTSSPSLGTLTRDKIIKIVLPKEIIDDETCIWVKIHYNNMAGWVEEKFIKLSQYDDKVDVNINNSDYRGAQILTSSQISTINELKQFYQKAAQNHGIPWQMLAAIHFREYNLRKEGPSNGDGPYQIWNSNYPVGSYTDTQFQSATNDAAKFVKSKAGSRDLSNSDNVKYVFFAYNGIAQAYKTQAINLGFTTAQANIGEGSPYVMNRYDAMRDPTVEPTKSNNTWGQIKADKGSVLYPANGDYGAFVIYKALGGP